MWFPRLAPASNRKILGQCLCSFVFFSFVFFSQHVSAATRRNAIAQGNGQRPGIASWLIPLTVPRTIGCIQRSNAKQEREAGQRQRFSWNEFRVVLDKKGRILADLAIVLQRSACPGFP